ncbi:MAG: hypothetical protein H6728_17365 [Myxococcales bacterium]|nr:hypothetical protein [Myxococcales bacterium]MCB9644843.1 hypothetical protein [Myxococcales bacterium]
MQRLHLALFSVSLCTLLGLSFETTTHAQSPTSKPTTQGAPASKPTPQGSPASKPTQPLLPPVGQLCNAVIETKIFALHKDPKTQKRPIQLHVRATYSLAVVQTTAKGYTVEGQTTSYVPISTMGHAPNDYIKGLLSIYAGVTWSLQLDQNNQILSLHHNDKEQAKRHRKVTERAARLLFLRWPTPKQLKARQWTSKRTLERNDSLRCTERENFQHKLTSRKNLTLTTQSILQQSEHCSNKNWTIKSKSHFEGSRKYVLGGLQQDVTWKGYQESIMGPHQDPAKRSQNKRSMLMRVTTTCP